MISIREAKDITISVLALSLALSIAQGGGIKVFATPLKLIFMISFFAITVGTGFVLHELAHKFVAMRFKGYAEFKMWTQGLILALVFSLFGFVFVAPGAVYIYLSRITKMQNGLISLAGPLMNLALSLFFLVLGFVLPFKFGELNIWGFASFVNIWLGLFNMIPIFPLDGSKIIDWSIFVWGAFSAIFVAMFLLIGAL